MDLTRRQTILAGLGLLAAGCSQTTTSSLVLPEPDWPRSYREPNRSLGTPAPAPVTQAAPKPAPAAVAGVNVIPRSQWTRSAPIASKINPMAGVSRITVHHEGWTPVWFSDRRSTAERIETIRQAHINDRGWGDIGYHYIIDRSGSVWEGRPVKYQGAHVRQNNEHNLGILVLGNFDRQSPTDIQIAQLEKTVQAFKSQYRVPVGRVFTHQEIVATACPGTNLQRQMSGVRRHLV